MALMLGELAGVITLDDKPFEKGLGESQRKLEGFGAKGKVMAAAAGVAIGAALAAGIASAMNVDKAKDKLNAQLGLTGKDAEKAGKTAGKLYAGAYGESMEDVTGAVGAVMSSIKGMRTASEADVEAVTAKVLDMSSAFEIDATRAAQVAGQMITNGLAKDSTEALDLLVGNLQKVPAAVREDLLDAVDEYGPFFRDLGIGGADAMGMLARASEDGMYGIDKTGDALKEFTIRSTDMSKATGTAYETLGLDTQEMTNKLLAGGDTASGALGEIINSLTSMEDPGERAATALALFGTPLEDLSVTEIPNFLGMIDPMGDAFDTMAGKADELGTTLNDNAATNLETFRRGLEMGITDTLNNHVVPAINDAAKWINSSFIPALEGAGQWIKDNQGWLIPLTAAVAGYVAVMGAMAILSTVRGWVAAAAAAQWGLNAAMAANPVGLVVAGIAALVAGVIWAYNNIGWFKDGVDAAFKWIGEAVQNVVNWWNQTLIPALQDVGKWFSDIWTGASDAVGTAMGWVQDAIGNAVSWIRDNWGLLLTIILGPLGFIIQWVVNNWSQISDTVQDVFGKVAAGFTWLYETIIKPVFDSISTVVGGFALFFRGVFQLVSSIITNVVVPLFQWFWGRMVEAFAAIGKTISDWWNGAVAVFNTVVGFIHRVLAAAFTWLRDRIINPVWNTITSIVKTAWTAISGVFNTIVTFIRTTLAAGFTWFRDSVITPVWNGIRSAIDGAWRFIRGIFEGISSFIRTTLSAAFTWFRDNVISPVWNRIQTIIKNVWEKDIKPVFDTLMNFVKKTIPDAFNSGVGFIKTAWNKLVEIAKTPVRFVIERIINDGLIGAFNTIAGILPGIDKLPPVAVPGWLKAGAGFAEGGYTGRGRKHDPAGIVHAGEIVWSQDDIRRHGGVGAVEGMRRGPGYADGGRVAPLKNLAVTQGYNRVHKGIDYAAAVGTPVYATQNGVVNHAGPGARAPGVWGGNEIHIAGSGLEAWFAHLSRIGVGVGDRVRAGQQIGLSGNTGISSGPHLHFGVFNGGWPNDIDPNAYLGGAGAPSGGGFNPIAGIIDGLVNTFKDTFAGAGFIADIALGIGKKLMDSVSGWVTNSLGGSDKKGNAVGLSPTVYDGGGWLPNTGGPQLVQHNKSKPDAVLSDQQWADIHKLALGNAGGVNYSPTYQWMGDNPHEVMRRDKARAMDMINALV